MNAQPPTDPIRDEDVRVGSYSLETLTTGMYEEPLHCVREYVQNAFDAIRSARATGLLSDAAGLVTIAISGSAKRPTLSIKDDGEGIPSAIAATTLVSIGASRKRSAINAGFRGIGRLAGIAYCTTLRFTTSARGEDKATVVEFDCGKMRGYMRPGADVQDVVDVMVRCATTGTRAAAVNDHFTEVEMIGLNGIGVEFAEIDRLVPYLRQVCPTDYSDRFTPAPKIRAFATSLGHPLAFVEIETRYKREKNQILKAYDDSAPTKGKTSIITDVELINSAELGWHGWIGLSNFKGEIIDDTVAGIRFRIKNIQVGGSDIIEDLGADLTVGGTEGRLQRWAVGEIFITDPAVVPNARRDGFEDGTRWREIRADIRARVARRVVTLVRNASTSRKTLKSIQTDARGVSIQLNREWIDEETAGKISDSIDKLLVRLRSDKLTGGEPNEVGEQVSKLKEMKDKLVELRNRPRPEPDPEPEPDAEPEPESGEAESGDDGARSSFGDWPSNALLNALMEVLTEEFGDDEAQRLIGLACGLLETREQ
ncbi:ATP-binding protein [Sphingomonas sabuli]|uniref:ATP-binding protein n=1 Tax=Sphingomonas sabuli TaxID=2764186 RepID=A0A7G9L3W4_9SPHN|nr:ATP-binding protein [Sphingomonas sabuli]QNM83313.1 ATP-binding protein [Sphingomonas sabuli]